MKRSAGISAWIKHDHRTFYFLLYLMLILKHLFTSDQGSFENIRYSGKWRLDGGYVMVGNVGLSYMTLFQVSFCILSAILVLFGGRMPHFVDMLLLCTLQLCGYSATIEFLDSSQDSMLVVRELLDCTAIICLTLSLLPKEVKQSLSCWRDLFLNLNLAVSLLIFISMITGNFSLTVFTLDILPLGGLCATTLVILGLKTAGLQSMLRWECGEIVNFSTVIWVGLNLFVQMFFSVDVESILDEASPLSDNLEYDPWYYLSYDDVNSGLKIISVYSMAICISSVYIYNLLGRLEHEINSVEPKDIDGDERGSCIEYSRSSLVARERQVIFIYLITAIFMAGYTCFNSYIYLSFEDQVDKFNKGEEIIMASLGTNETNYDDWYVSFFQNATDWYHIIKGFNDTAILGDCLLQYLAYALMSLKCIVFESQTIMSFSLITISGYIASTSLVNSYSGADGGRYILAHVALICVTLDSLSHDKKLTLSRWRNHFIFLSQICGQLFLILGMHTKNIGVFLTLCILILVEAFGAMLLLGYINKGIKVGKISKGFCAKCLYGYTIIWFCVSIIFEIGFINSNPDGRRLGRWKGDEFIIGCDDDALDCSIEPVSGIAEFINGFCSDGSRSIVFHVSPMLIYSLLSTWFFEGERNA